MQAGFSAGWPVVTRLFPELISEQAERLAPKLPDHLPTLLDAITADTICISHGDMRLYNIFFGPDHIALVDFQAVSKSAP